MRESDLKEFLEGDRDASWLVDALERATDADGLVADLDAAVMLTSDELRLLCDAHLSHGLPPNRLQTVAGYILESDNFAWDEASPEGELVAEILWDWAMPEDESPPTSETVQACRRRLAES